MLMQRISEKKALRRLQRFIKTFETQQEFADFAGVSDAFVSHIMVGHRKPSKKLLALAGIKKTVIRTSMYEVIK